MARKNIFSRIGEAIRNTAKKAVEKITPARLSSSRTKPTPTQEPRITPIEQSQHKITPIPTPPPKVTKIKVEEPRITSIPHPTPTPTQPPPQHKTPFNQELDLIRSLKENGIGNNFNAEYLRETIRKLSPILSSRVEAIKEKNGVPSYYFLEYPDAGNNPDYLSNRLSEEKLDNWGRNKLLMELTKLVNALSAPSLTLEGAIKIAARQDEMIFELVGSKEAPIMSYEERSEFWKAYTEFKNQYPASTGQHGYGAPIPDFYHIYKQEFGANTPFEIDASKFARIRDILAGAIDVENERSFIPNVQSGRRNS